MKKMEKAKKRILSVLLALSLSLALLPGTALADETGGGPVPSKNIGANNYPPANWAVSMKSYLYENEDGGLTRVEYVGDKKVVVEDYSSDFSYIPGSGTTIELEDGMDRWGGFFAGETYNFLIYGKWNAGEDNSVEVIRVVKYDKDWNRLGDARLLGGNTTRPFDDSLRCAESNGKLYIRTGHRMYKAYDGVNHQASMMMLVDEETMEMQSWTGSSCPYGRASHSFNQFVLIDQEGRVVTADHGDTYPRSLVLWQNGKAATIQALTKGSYLGDNVTGASFGGLAETTNGYVSAYNYANASNNRDPRQIYLGYTAKNGLKTAERIELTEEGVGGKTPALVSTSLEGGYILWNGTDNNSNTLYYAPYYEAGEGDEVKLEAGEVQERENCPMSDCQPVCYNGQIVWYTTNNSAPVFHTLALCEEHSPEGGLVSNKRGSHGQKCAACGTIVNLELCTYGEETETKAPTCSENGERTAVCTECGYEKVTPVPKTEHEFVRDEAGNQYCKNCGQTIPGDMTQVYDAIQNLSLDGGKINIDPGQTDEELAAAIKEQIKKFLQNSQYEITVEIQSRGAAKYSYIVRIIGPDGIVLTVPKELNLSADEETYYISIPNVSNGEIIPNTRYAAQGERVTLTAHPADGCELTGDISVTDIRGRAVAVRELSGNSYSFTMPASRVTVDAKFEKIQEEAPSDTAPGADAPSAADEPFTGLGTPGISGIVLNPAPMPFTDVRSNDWFYNSAEYVWKHYLMSGVSDTQFAPGDTTTRAMIWTVLARMNNVRTDVNPGPNWYDRGMTWAMEQGITDGSSPMDNITREQLAAMLWRSAGSPGVTADLSGFSDNGSISGYAQGAVSWAVAAGILNGSDGKLEPQGTATRAQVAAMVMRYGERVGA